MGYITAKNLLGGSEKHWPLSEGPQGMSLIHSESRNSSGSRNYRHRRGPGAGFGGPGGGFGGPGVVLVVIEVVASHYCYYYYYYTNHPQDHQNHNQGHQNQHQDPSYVDYCYYHYYSDF